MRTVTHMEDSRREDPWAARLRVRRDMAGLPQVPAEHRETADRRAGTPGCRAAAPEQQEVPVRREEAPEPQETAECREETPGPQEMAESRAETAGNPEMAYPRAELPEIQETVRRRAV